MINAKAWIFTKSTKEQLSELQPKPIAKPSPMTRDEQLKFAYILRRFENMKSTRAWIDKYWNMYRQQFEAKFFPYTDWRSRSNVPLEWAIVELFVAECLSRKSQLTLEPIGESDIEKVEILKRVKDFDWNMYNRENEIYKSEYITAIWGTCFYFNGFESSSRVIRDVDYFDDWKVKLNKILTENKILLKCWDIRNIYFDDRAPDYESANDCVYIDYITPEQLQGLKNNKSYKNLDKVWVFNKREQVFFMQSEMFQYKDKLVELMHYFNKQADQYVVIANRNMIVRDQPLPYMHKKLPLVPRQYSYNPFSIYGRWLCEALVSFKSQLNDLKEMIMDWVKRSNNSLFAIWWWLTFDWEEFGFNNSLVRFNGSLAWNFQEIRWNPPNQAIFSYTDQLLKDIAIFVWIDPSWIVWQPSSTAFETAVRQESSLKRVNVVLANRDLALKEVYTQYIQNLQQFFPITSAKSILELIEDSKWNTTEKETETQWPSILLKNEKPVQTTTGTKIVKAEGRFPLEVTPEMIRGNFDIQVKTNFNLPWLKSLEIENMKSFLSSVIEYSQARQLDPNLDNIINPDDFLKDLAFKMNVDVDNVWWFKDSITKKKEELLNQVKQIAWLPQTPWWTWWTPSPQQQWNQWIPQWQTNLLPNVSQTPAWWLVRQPQLPWNPTPPTWPALTQK